MLTPKKSKTCERCKLRKVRCIASPTGNACTNCLKRGEECHFRLKAKRLPRRSALQSNDEEPSNTHIPQLAQSPNPASEPSRIIPSDVQVSPGLLYVDHLLENYRAEDIDAGRQAILKPNELHVASSSIALFSEAKIASVSARVGHDGVRELVEALETKLKERIADAEHISGNSIAYWPPLPSMNLSRATTHLYIEAYFNNVHPIYPFLDRARFEEQAMGPQCDDSAWSALFHTVLALGCQYHDEGSFHPGTGQAWNLFRVALGLVRQVVAPRAALLRVQALLAMAIFATYFSCMHMDEFLLQESTRMAMAIGLHKYTGTESEHQRTFWVIYALEKSSTFADARVSLINDYDISCSLPSETQPHNNWLRTQARFARLRSRVYEDLFSSTSRALHNRWTVDDVLDKMFSALERWKESVPERMRPCTTVRSADFLSIASQTIAVTIHFSYYDVLIVLSRLALSITDAEDTTRRNRHIKTLVDSAYAIVDLLQHVDIKPYTSYWLLGTVPLAALFTLFDFVVHNPELPEIKRALLYLDIAGGYFSRVELASNGSLRTSELSGFTRIARDYVSNVIGKSNLEALPSVDREDPFAVAASQINDLSDPSSIPMQLSDLDLMLGDENGLQITSLFSSAI